MSDVEIGLQGAAVLLFGGVLLWIAILVVGLHKKEARLKPKELFFWDLTASILTGPWSVPLALAAMLASLAVIAIVFGLYFVLTSIV